MTATKTKVVSFTANAARDTKNFVRFEAKSDDVIFTVYVKKEDLAKAGGNLLDPISVIIAK